MKRQFRERMSAVISDFQPDLIVAAIPLTEFFLCDLLQVTDTVPVVIESHLARGHEALARTFTEKALDVFYSPLRAIRRADLLIALTEEDAHCWKRTQVEKVRVIPNPLTFYPTTLTTVPREAGRIVCVGRLAMQKRFDRLIDAFALICDSYPKWHVDVYGAGEERQQLTDRIRIKGLQDRIHLNLPTSEIYTEYQRSEFFVLCSDYEGFGLVVIEAMACGIPVVSTDCPFGPSEIIEDGKTGLLAKMDTNDLAEKMEWMITHEEERTAMGIAARQAAARYRKEIVMPQWEQAYLSVIK
jgi:glycosyltransferase involved in cell wall biosynthesis